MFKLKFNVFKYKDKKKIILNNYQNDPNYSLQYGLFEVYFNDDIIFEKVLKIEKINNGELLFCYDLEYGMYDYIFDLLELKNFIIYLKYNQNREISLFFNKNSNVDDRFHFDGRIFSIIHKSKLTNTHFKIKLDYETEQFAEELIKFYNWCKFLLKSNSIDNFDESKYDNCFYEIYKYGSDNESDNELVNELDNETNNGSEY